MRRNTFKLILLSVIILCTALTAYFAIKNILEDQQARQVAKNLTTLLEGLPKIDDNGDQMSYNAKSLLVYFNSECQNCHTQLSLLNRNLVNLEVDQLIFVSSQPPDEVLSYLSQYKQLSKQKKYFIFLIHIGGVSKHFGSTVVPQLLLYNENTLIKHFKGVTNLNAIQKHLA